MTETFRQVGLEGLKPLDRQPDVLIVEKEPDDLGDGGPMHYVFLDLKPKRDNY